VINWFSHDYEMVQIPVLAPPTGGAEFTRSICCAKFAEFQQKDIRVRQRLGGFLPGNGVGRAFARAALERLAQTRAGCFDWNRSPKITKPACCSTCWAAGTFSSAAF
jgi:adsorption protein B